MDEMPARSRGRDWRGPRGRGTSDAGCWTGVPVPLPGISPRGRHGNGERPPRRPAGFDRRNPGCAARSVIVSAHCGKSQVARQSPYATGSQRAPGSPNAGACCARPPLARTRCPTTVRDGCRWARPASDCRLSTVARTINAYHVPRSNASYPPFLPAVCRPVPPDGARSAADDVAGIRDLAGRGVARAGASGRFHQVKSPAGRLRRPAAVRAETSRPFS